jgi:hypothetical protein
VVRPCSLCCEGHTGLARAQYNRLTLLPNPARAAGGACSGALMGPACVVEGPAGLARRAAAACPEGHRQLQLALHTPEQFDYRTEVWADQPTPAPASHSE